MPVAFDIAGGGYSIRPAGPGDAKAVRMLLPGMGDTSVSLVAVDGQRGLVIGAAAAARLHRRRPMGGPGIAIHVIEPCRRHRIGTNLLHQIERSARTTGAKALYSAKRVEPDSAEMRGWQWLGFTACETVEQHRVPLVDIATHLAPLIQRIRERGRIPESARIISLYQADLPTVLKLHLDNMGGDATDLMRRLRGEGPGAFLPQHSRVLLVDGKIKGCLLAHRKDGDTIVVDANIIDRSVRGGWANPLVKFETARGALSMGAKNLEYTTFDHYEDSRSFTDRLGGIKLSTSMLMFRRLEKTDVVG